MGLGALVEEGPQLRRHPQDHAGSGAGGQGVLHPEDSGCVAARRYQGDDPGTVEPAPPAGRVVVPRVGGPRSSTRRSTRPATPWSGRSTPPAVDPPSAPGPRRTPRSPTTKTPTSPARPSPNPRSPVPFRPGVPGSPPLSSTGDEGLPAVGFAGPRLAARTDRHRSERAETEPPRGGNTAADHGKPACQRVWLIAGTPSAARIVREWRHLRDEHSTSRRCGAVPGTVSPHRPVPEYRTTGPMVLPAGRRLVVTKGIHQWPRVTTGIA
jgi:hypothetical protein